MATNRMTERKERDIEIPDTLFSIKSWNLTLLKHHNLKILPKGTLIQNIRDTKRYKLSSWLKCKAQYWLNHVDEYSNFRRKYALSRSICTKILLVSAYRDINYVHLIKTIRVNNLASQFRRSLRIGLI